MIIGMTLVADEDFFAKSELEERAGFPDWIGLRIVFRLDKPERMHTLASNWIVYRKRVDKILSPVSISH